MSKKNEAAFDTILFRKEDHVATIALNRPEAMNSYNIQMRNELFQVLEAIRIDSEIRVVIIRGIGEKAFCAGADLSEFLSAPPPVEARKVRWARDIWGLFASIPQPVIAALHGYVLGSGIEMSLFCDIRIATESARFGLPEVKLGMLPAAGGTQTLPRSIGYPRAIETLLTNRWLKATEAWEAGLVNRLVPEENLQKEVAEIAKRIATFNVQTVRLLKAAVKQGMDLPLRDALNIEKRMMLKLVSGFRNGV